MIRWESDLPTDVLGEDLASTLEAIVSRERAAHGWAWFVTAGHLMGKWSWLVDEIERRDYADGLVEEYANDLDARKILDDVLAASPAPLAERLREWLAPLDQRFLDATVRAPEPVHGSADPASPHAASQWHWRIPKDPCGQLGDGLAERGLV